MRQILFAISSFLMFASLALADWPQFRGPGGSGSSSQQNLPEKWSEKENVRWRTELPGLGTSSPILIGDRVFVTCYSGYAESADRPGDMKELRRHVVCLNRIDGKIAWQKTIDPVLPESEYVGGNNTWHGYSSSTPVSDGKHVFIFFGKTGVLCFDLEGEQIWRADVGQAMRGWGSSNSPVLYKDSVIVNASIESNSLVALEKATGKEKWRAGNIKGSWNTPVLVQLANGSTEVVVSLPERLIAYDPETGKQLWTCAGIPDSGYVCPSAIAHEGIVYVIGGRKNTAMAVRAGGEGDVTESHVIWTENKGSNVSSPVYHEGHLYWVHERQATLNCLAADTGEVVFQERIEPRPGVVYSSVVVADGKLYSVSQHNGTYVFAAEPKYKLIAHNVFTGDDNRANASPAIGNGEIFLRNDKYIYCIGNQDRLAKAGQ